MGQVDARTRKRDVTSIFAWGVPLAIITVHLFFRVEIERGPNTLFRATLPGIDLCIWMLTGLRVLIWATACLGRGRGAVARRCRVPTDIKLFLGIAILSSVSTVISSDGIRDFIQLVDYYVMFYVLVRYASQSTKFANVMAWTSITLVAVYSLAAFWQLGSSTPAYAIRSVFLDSFSFQGALVMLLPLAWSALNAIPQRWGGALAATLIAFAVAVSGSLGTSILLFVLMAIASYVNNPNWKKQFATFAGLTVLLMCSFSFLFPNSISYSRQCHDLFFVPMARNRAEVKQAEELLRPPEPTAHFGLGKWHLFWGSNLRTWMQPVSPVEVNTPDRPVRVVYEYYAECWAALTLIQDSPVFGWGLGNWQSKLGTAFGMLERTGTAYPNHVNGYLLLGVTTGAFGLLAWCMASLRAMKRAQRAMNTNQASCRAYAVGCFTGLLGATVFMFFSPIATQPTAAIWILLAASTHGIQRAK